MKQQENIRCAAIHYDDPKQYNDQPLGIINGFVMCGYRHDNIRSTMEQVIPYYDKLFASKYNEGFLTSYNRFVHRKEAFQIAKEAGQLLYPDQPWRDEKMELSSEDLY